MSFFSIIYTRQESRIDAIRVSTAIDALRETLENRGKDSQTGNNVEERPQAFETGSDCDPLQISSRSATVIAQSVLLFLANRAHRIHGNQESSSNCTSARCDWTADRDGRGRCRCCASQSIFLQPAVPYKVSTNCMQFGIPRPRQARACLPPGRRDSDDARQCRLISWADKRPSPGRRRMPPPKHTVRVNLSEPVDAIRVDQKVSPFESFGGGRRRPAEPPGLRSLQRLG